MSFTLNAKSSIEIVSAGGARAGASPLSFDDKPSTDKPRTPVLVPLTVPSSGVLADADFFEPYISIFV